MCNPHEAPTATVTLNYTVARPYIRYRDLSDNYLEETQELLHTGGDKEVDIIQYHNTEGFRVTAHSWREEFEMYREGNPKILRKLAVVDLALRNKFLRREEGPDDRKEDVRPYITTEEIPRPGKNPVLKGLGELLELSERDGKLIFHIKGSAGETYEATLEEVREYQDSKNGTPYLEIKGVGRVLHPKLNWKPLSTRTEAGATYSGTAKDYLEDCNYLAVVEEGRYARLFRADLVKANRVGGYTVVKGTDVWGDEEPLKGYLAITEVTLSDIAVKTP